MRSVQNKNQGFIIPLLVLIIAALVVGGGVYVYKQNQAANNQKNIIATSTNPDANTQVDPTKQSSITVTSPKAGDVLNIGQTYSITWTSNNVGNQPLFIDLRSANDTRIKEFATNVSNTGSYSWTIDSSIPAGNYMVSVYTSDNIDKNGANVAWGKSGVFTIKQSDSPAPGGISVSGMSKYTDSDFGFSFWYPSSWKLVQPIVTSPTDNGWFKDGSVVKKLVVNDLSTGLDTTGITIEEFHSNGFSITELGQTKSASPVGVDQKYYFDPNIHTWMYENLTDAPNGLRPAGTVSAADITRNTMGGLHMFLGAQRFGADTIVPLSAENFLVISTNSPGGFPDQNYLVRTILATDPAVATPVAVTEQAKIVQAEKDTYLTYSPLSWNTYDSGRGFSFKYPNDFTLDNGDSRPDKVIFIYNEDGQRYFVVTTENATTTLEQNVKDTVASLQANSINAATAVTVSYQPYILGNHQGFLITSKANDVLGNTDAIFKTQKGNTIFSFKYSYANALASHSNAINEVYLILSSFN